MKLNLIQNENRGKADYGWLKTNYSFSFATWFDPSKMGFGALRVLNDDTISPSAGFPPHSHQNMEIVTISILGSLAHKDSTGTNGIIQAGEIQIMSAGTGITHSEYNASNTEYLKLFQIWVIPNKTDLTPRYDQARFDTKNRQNTWQTIVSPHPEDSAQPQKPLKIYQETFFSLVDLDQDKQINYQLNNSNNGVYLMLIDGQIQINHILINSRDAVEILETDLVEIQAISKSSILAIEVAMI